MKTSQGISYMSLQRGGRAWRPSSPPEGGRDGRLRDEEEEGMIVIKCTETTKTLAPDLDMSVLVFLVRWSVSFVLN